VSPRRRRSGGARGASCCGVAKVLWRAVISGGTDRRRAACIAARAGVREVGRIRARARARLPTLIL